MTEEDDLWKKKHFWFLPNPSLLPKEDSLDTGFPPEDDLSSAVVSVPDKNKARKPLFTRSDKPLKFCEPTAAKVNQREKYKFVKEWVHQAAKRTCANKISPRKWNQNVGQQYREKLCEKVDQLVVKNGLTRNEMITRNPQDRELLWLVSPFNKTKAKSWKNRKDDNSGLYGNKDDSGTTWNNNNSRGLSKYQAFKINKCINSNWRRIYEPVKKRVEGLQFSYMEFQRIIQLELELNTWNFFQAYFKPDYRGPLDEMEFKCSEETNQVMKVLREGDENGIERKIASSFQRFYGPVELTHPSTQDYFKNFKDSLKEQAIHQIRMLEYLQKTAVEHGPEVVHVYLQTRKDELGERIRKLRIDLESKKIIYNMNPFTNIAHVDYFLIDRPSAVQQAKFGVYPGALKSLVEFKPRPAHNLAPLRESVPQRLHIKGYWPSLLDYSSLHPLPLAEDPRSDKVPKIRSKRGLTKNEENEEKERNTRMRRALLRNEGETDSEEDPDLEWEALLLRMSTIIWKYPTGISMKNFAKVVKEGFYRKSVPLFGPKLTLGKGCSKLKEVFFLSKLNNRTILFPAYLRGIAPASMLPLLYKVWKRFKFLADVHEGGSQTLKWNEMEDMHWKVFQTRVSCWDWGFASVKDFMDWGEKQWGKDEQKKEK